MKNKFSLKKISETGFTLVELAIVLVIIGLLIGGVLRGQELMQNAKVTATAKQMMSYSAAYNTFVDTYYNVPGDFANPGSYIPDCTTAPCNTGGNGNGKIENTTEYQNFWLHLAKAHLITGINQNAIGANLWPTTPFANTTVQAMSWSGHGVTFGLNTLWLRGKGVTTTVFTPMLAYQIDKKIDDGLPNSGNVLAFENGSINNNFTTPNDATTCEDGTNYNVSNPAVLCSLWFSL